MKGDFYFQYYRDQSIADKVNMTPAEQGFYHMIIDLQFLHGRLYIKQIRNLVGKHFNRYWAVLSSKLEEEDGMYFIPWVDKSLKKREKRSEQNKKAVAVKNRKALLKSEQHNWK